MMEASIDQQFEREYVREQDRLVQDYYYPVVDFVASFGSSALMWVLPGITGILGLAFPGAVFAVQKLMPSTESAE